MEYPDSGYVLNYVIERWNDATAQIITRHPALALEENMEGLRPSAYADNPDMQKILLKAEETAKRRTSSTSPAPKPNIS
ncbi:MAG TPA: hypothetical protein DCW68_05940 [Rhodospirillaceae bacterium]|nr:MAG: hypothetical protein A2018_03505 [Alphaproteobacteria bacterium GWF2_58_20]HAU29634.1 hypothetical protein [Rhodospirillaceae bacterium]